MLNLAQRPDNKHIWFPFCVATPVFALFSFGPLAARRMTRFPRFAAVFAEETWTFRSNVLESLHFATLAGAPAYLYANHAQSQRAVGEAEADRDYQTIVHTRRLLEKTRFVYPAFLTWLLRPMEPKESVAASPGKLRSHVDRSFRCLASSRCGRTHRRTGAHCNRYHPTAVFLELPVDDA